jgi:hypothetical protein
MRSPAHRFTIVSMNAPALASSAEHPPDYASIRRPALDPALPLLQQTHHQASP